MAESERQLKGRAHPAAIAALEVVPFAMLITDGAGQALAVNQRWTDLAGLSRTDSLGTGWLRALESDARHQLLEALTGVGRHGEGTSADFQIHVGGRPRWLRWWLSRHELDGLPLVAVAAADVDDDYTRLENLYHLATHDALTGLVNRSHFMDCIAQALRRNQRAARHVAVVYVDLDDFKRVNDEGGHSLGDRVLYAIAARLRHAVRSADMVARIGGDEFAVLCEGLSAIEQAEVVAHRIAQALAESVELDGERWSVAASVGAAVDSGDPDTPEELVDRADRAMYSVKLTRRAPAEPGPDPRFDAGAGAVAAAVLDDPLFDDRFVAARLSSYGGAEYRLDPPLSDSEPTAAPEEQPPRLSWQRSTSGTGPAGRRSYPQPPPGAAGHHVPLPEPSASRPGATPGSPSRHESRSSVAAPPAAAVAPPDASELRMVQEALILRDSLDSIRRMLDRLLATERGVIDIRDAKAR